tara:strand:+ start:967 stop:3156 length:2190 start_codon:yes stop_codon:yes gene_type:complete
MRKIIYRTFIIILILISVSILYLSVIGIKTDKFNSQIISKVKNFEPNLKLKLNDVSAKLNLFTFTIDAKTVGTDLIIKNKTIQLENIKSKISLKSIINNQFALSKIFISTKSVPIKELLGFIRLINKDPKLFIAEQFIDNGYVVADLKLEFNKNGKIKKNYKINGLVNSGQILLLKKKVSKLDFIFEITENKFSFFDIKFLLNGKKITVPKLKALKQKKEFLVSGNFDNDNTSLKKSDIKDLFENSFIKSNLKEILFSSDNNFSFKIDKNLKLKNFNIESIINLDKLRIDNIFELKDFVPNIKKEIELKNQKIELKYNNDKIEITGSGKIFLQKEADNVQYKILKNKEDIFFDLNIKISKNPFLIKLINFEKDDKSILDLNFKGKFIEDKFFFEKILISENKNSIFIKNLELSKKNKVDDIERIEIDFVDNDKVQNIFKIKKGKKNYRITGKSLNINKIVSDLLDAKDKGKKKFFNKDLNFIFDIKKIYLDQNNSANNLKGSILLKNNEITDLNLVSNFDNSKKIKFTIKTSDNGEKITTLFSDEAKPLVDRYKFIKGFNEGNLDFFSIKKENKSSSTLKIYDFKLKELPVLTKILTLASLQGIADLLSGEGIRFDEMEMKFTNKDNLMTIDEIYAIGPAISILMEGYIEKNNLISLRGTLVPATTINKTISSIPVIGNILVGKKAGEGVFGVSFKIKGPPKDLSTSVNPIKSLTPRFITRTLEKIKKN